MRVALKFLDGTLVDLICGLHGAHLLAPDILVKGQTTRDPTVQFKVASSQDLSTTCGATCHLVP